MCTLSWLMTHTGYEVFFNRDEQRSREKAIPPRLLMNRGVEYLAPRDPQGGGSWIAVNQFGLTFCLLNYYQGVAGDAVQSRGALLVSLVDCSGYHQVRERLESMNLCDYAAFTLLVFKKTPLALCWDGSLLFEFTPGLLTTSSAVDFEKVVAWREQKQLSFHERSRQSLLELHHSHNDKAPHLGLCMHRNDAETVSFSQVQVSHREALFTYRPGAPCHKVKALLSKIELRA